jgi:hypothetical protein
VSVIGDTVRVTLALPTKRTCDPAEYPDLPRIESQGSVVSLSLDDRLQASLDSVAPGFTPYGLDVYEDWIVSGYSLQCHQAPSAVLGDFNGDGVSDLAAIGRAGNQEVDLVLISTADSYLVARNSRANGVQDLGSAIVYYVRAEPQVINSAWEPAPLTLMTHAVHEIAEEKSSTLYYWLGGEWRMYTTSD